MDLQFGEVVNPQYAYPIVGVILCAVLVFAFGFKSPAQPPSFDLVEYERKIKKHKKDRQKQKLQNGQTVTASASPRIQNKNVPEVVFKPKTEKSSPRNKPEPKSKKANQESQVEKEHQKVIVTEAPPASEDSEGEWVQKLSKKEKKNRRREEKEEEGAQSSVSETATGSHENTPSKQKKKQKEEKKESKVAEEAEPVKQATEEDVSPPAPPPQQDTPKNQRSSKKKGKKESSAPPVETKIAETQENVRVEDQVIEEAPTKVEPEPPLPNKTEENEEFQEVESKSKAKKKKAKKKSSPENSTESEANKENEREISIEPEPVVTQVSEPTKGMAPAPEKSIEIPETVNQKEEKEAPGTSSNVVFDELGDIPTADSKQKKKKKARRE